ncbi:MAG: methylenetetrahydrofolate reductase [Anaerolineae bacterium]
MREIANSNLARVLEAGHFAVAVEVCPPVGPNPGMVYRQIEVLRGYADAYNVTDNQSARVHTSSLAVSIMLKQAGLDPVVQFTCRDRNRLAIQSDLLGAAAFGITNVLALSGDHVSAGDHPHVKPVYDTDSINLIRMIQMMRDDQVFESGKHIPRRAPEFFVGAVANPFAPPYEFRPIRLAKKVAAGAQFIQTQLIYDVDRFREFMARVVDLGLHEKVSILAGVGPIRSLRAAEFMANRVAGLIVPEGLVRRLEGLSKEGQAQAGLDICIEIAQEVREIEGVRGLHIMAVNWADAVPQVVEALDLYPRPRFEAVLQTDIAQTTSPYASASGGHYD